jgi:hypothetical protein
MGEGLLAAEDMKGCAVGFDRDWFQAFNILRGRSQII